jgi:hypothetical protein
MNSAAQQAQHMSGSKHRALVAAAFKAAAGPFVELTSSASSLPHGTGPYYQTLASEWAPGVGPSLQDGVVVPALPDPAQLSVSDLEVARGGSGGGSAVGVGFGVSGSVGGVPSADMTTPATVGAAAAAVKDDPAAMQQWVFNQAYITAVKSGDTVEAARLLADGVDVDTRDSGCPALHWAIFMGRVEMVELLVSSGARKDLQDRDRQTAVHICLHPRHGMMSNQMKRDKVTVPSPKYEADAVRVLTALLKAGWSPDVRDALGRTGMHHVAEQGNCALALLLLKFNANPALHNKDG